MQSVGVYLVTQPEGLGGTAELLFCLFFHCGQDVGGMLLHFPDREDVAGMEWQGHHGLDFGQVYAHHAVVEGRLFHLQLLVVALAAVYGQILFNLVIRFPDGGKTGCFRCHDVYAAAVFHGQAGNAGTGKFHDLVFNKAVFEDGADDGQGHILGTYARLGGILQPDEHNAGPGNVIGAAQKLLHKLWPALSYGHAAQCAVARMAVRS